MKGIDIFCASQASTSIRLAMEEGSSSSTSSSSLSSSTIHLGNTRAIDRHNPTIRDARRIGKAFAPCSAQSPINPIPYHKHNNNNNNNQKGSNKSRDQTKKSSSKPVLDSKRKGGFAKPIHENGNIKKSFGAKLGDFISPPGSTRYLLSDQRDFLDVLSDFDPVLKLVPAEPTKSQAVHDKIDDESSASKSSASPDQVVVLRVSLHCRGCEGKVRKHISRMQGVTSFSIDFAAKKVTIVGDITPLGVLESVSKIKSAQLWTPPISSSLPSCGSSNTDIKKPKENYENSTTVIV